MKDSQHTQVLDIDSTPVPQAGIVHGNAGSIGNGGSIAALSDPQSVNRELRDTRNLAENLRRRGIRIDGDGLGEALDRAAWWGVSFAQIGKWEGHKLN